MKRRRSLTALMCALCSVGSPAYALSLNQSDALAHRITLYQQAPALIQSHFPKSQDTELQIDGLPITLDPSSVLLSRVNVRELSWSVNTDPFTQALKAAVGSSIDLIHLETQERIQAELLAVTPPYLQILRDGQIQRIPQDSPWSVSLPYQPGPQRGVLKLDGVEAEPDAQSFEVSYLGAGLEWRPEYSIELLSDTELTLKAQAAIHNRTGVDYPEASVDLLAGQPQQAAESLVPRLMAMSADRAAAPAVEAVQGYYLFKLSEPLDLNANSAVQIPFLPTQRLDAELSYRYEHWVSTGYRAESQKQHARQWLKFTLPEALSDSPLPQGVAKLYRRDSEGQLRFVGSQQLANTAPGQTLDLEFGDAFDLKVQRQQTDYQRQGNVYRQSYEVVFSNGDRQERRLEYRLRFRQPWSLIDASTEALAERMEALWTVTIPARSSVTLTYTLDLNQL